MASRSSIVLAREARVDTSSAPVRELPGNIRADPARSIQRARRWAAPVHPEDVPVLVALDPALADRRALVLVVLGREQGQRRHQQRQAARSAHHRAAADVASSSIRRPKKGR